MLLAVAIPWYIHALAIGFVLTCAFMVMVILVQKPKGGGLTGAFGGAGSGSAQAVLGARVGDVLTWTTVIAFVLFLMLSIGLTWGMTPDTEAADANPSITSSQGDDDGDEGAADDGAEKNKEASTDSDSDADAEGDSAPAEAGAKIGEGRVVQPGEVNVIDPADTPALPEGDAVVEESSEMPVETKPETAPETAPETTSETTSETPAVEQPAAE